MVPKKQMGPKSPEPRPGLPGQPEHQRSFPPERPDTQTMGEWRQARRTIRKLTLEGTIIQRCNQKTNKQHQNAARCILLPSRSSPVLWELTHSCSSNSHVLNAGLQINPSCLQPHTPTSIHHTGPSTSLNLTC